MSAEYIGAVVLVGAIIAAVWATDISDRVSLATARTVCDMFDDDSWSCPDPLADGTPVPDADAEDGDAEADDAELDPDEGAATDGGADETPAGDADAPSAPDVAPSTAVPSDGAPRGPPLLADRFADGSGASPVWVEPTDGSPGGWDLTGDGVPDVFDTTGDGVIDRVADDSLGGLVGVAADPDALVDAIRDGRLNDVLGRNVPPGWWTATPEQRAAALRAAGDVLRGEFGEVFDDAFVSLRSLLDPGYGRHFLGDLDALRDAGPIGALSPDEQDEALRLVLSRRADADARHELLDGLPTDLVERWLDDPRLARRLGDAGGIPLDLRATANRQLAGNARDDLLAQRDEILERRAEQNLPRRGVGWVADRANGAWTWATRDGRGERRTWIDNVDDIVGLPSPTITDAAELDRLGRRIDFLEPYARGERTLLGFDAEGRGRLIEVFAEVDELAAARNVGIFVPGVANDIWNYEGRFGRQMGRMNDALAAEGHSDDTVYIAFSGYDTPRALLRPSAAQNRTTRAGAEALTSFTNGVVPSLEAERVVGVGHSMGAVVASRAAGPAGFDAAGLLGAPGAYFGTAEEIGIGAENVYVAMAEGDEIDTLRIPRTPFLHGSRPNRDNFGAQQMATNDVESNHVSYFFGGGLTPANVANLVAGDLDQVVLR